MTEILCYGTTVDDYETAKKLLLLIMAVAFVGFCFNHQAKQALDDM